MCSLLVIPLRAMDCKCVTVGKVDATRRVGQIGPLHEARSPGSCAQRHAMLVGVDHFQNTAIATDAAALAFPKRAPVELNSGIAIALARALAHSLLRRRWRVPTAAVGADLARARDTMPHALGDRVGIRGSSAQLIAGASPVAAGARR